MNCFTIQGGKHLNGSIDISGAKNSVLPILAASILHKGKTILHNCPNLSDVSSAIKILRSLGCAVRREGNAIEIDASEVSSGEITDELMREMRSSVTFFGAILARRGSARISLPGGCELGARPIELHIAALKKLGADIYETGGKICCDSFEPKAAEINLSFPSVGATENIMLAASACTGTTRIINPAREPEIVDLQNFLRKCGVSINGAGGSVIEINGADMSDKPSSTIEHTIIPDRIVSATYLCACAACGGHIRITNTEPSDLRPVISVLSDAGARFKTGEGFVEIKSSGLYDVGVVRTMPYPGFPTDAQAVLMAAAAKSSGSAIFIETIFENRFRHVAELVRMGADITVEGRTAIVTGVPELYGAPVAATDLRGGAALVIAGLCAKGQTVVSGISHIDRGYESLENAFRTLGADICRRGL